MRVYSGFLKLFVFSQQHRQVLSALKLKMRINRANRVLLVLFGATTLVLAKEGTYRIIFRDNLGPGWYPFVLLRSSSFVSEAIILLSKN